MLHNVLSCTSPPLPPFGMAGARFGTSFALCPFVSDLSSKPPGAKWLLCLRGIGVVGVLAAWGPSGGHMLRRNSGPGHLSRVALVPRVLLLGWDPAGGHSLQCASSPCREVKSSTSRGSGQGALAGCGTPWVVTHVCISILGWFGKHFIR